MLERAQALLREQFASGPKPGSHVVAAATAAKSLERSLIDTADALGLRTQCGQWLLPTP